MLLRLMGAEVGTVVEVDDAADLGSGTATAGQALTSDGNGNATWEDQ